MAKSKSKSANQQASGDSEATTPAVGGKPSVGAGRKTKPSTKAVVKARPAAATTVKDDRPAGDSADWREETLNRMRALILAADSEMVEEQKWKKPSNGMIGVPVWSHDGIVCTGETYKQVVKLTFAQGAKLPDPQRLFNASLDGNTRRAIDIREGEQVDAAAFKALVKAAVAQNGSSAKPAKSSVKAKPSAKTNSTAGTTSKRVDSSSQPVKLLSGGNPQIAKGYGDAPVQAYIAAMPGWKSHVGRRLDELIVQATPGVLKAVKWNSPFYGVEERTWFLGIHCMTKYIKVAFFRGASLHPLPPGASKQKEVRYLDIYEDEPLDEAQFIDWVKQASRLPGERM